ncbi:MAG: HEAT repeat domain-containing protein [Planctomycetota bacterium]
MGALLRLTLACCLTAICGGCISGMGGSASAPREKTPAEVPPPADWVQNVTFPEGLERPAPAREADILAACEALLSDDFGDRTRGSRALLAYGEPAIPYLGHRVSSTGLGPDPNCSHCIVIYGIVEELPASRVSVHLDSPYPIVRIAAAEAAGERDLDELAPALTRRLDDDELEVRRAAVTALRRMTRQFLGYRANDTPEARRPAIELWERETGAADG